MNRRGATASVEMARGFVATVVAASGTAASAACDIRPISKHGNSKPALHIERGNFADRVWPSTGRMKFKQVLGYGAELA
jgi:hypothetical protein